MILVAIEKLTKINGVDQFYFREARVIVCVHGSNGEFVIIEYLISFPFGIGKLIKHIKKKDDFTILYYKK